MKHVVTTALAILLCGCMPLAGEPGAATEKVSEASPPAGTLAPAVIKASMKSHVAGSKRCYEKELQKTPDLQGKLVVTFTITEEGSVTDVSIKSTTLDSPDMESCVVEDAKTWTFPKPEGGGVVVVSYPLIFASA